jgi:hypothetical protein
MRFPKLELSYETVSHKKVSVSASVAVAISLGKKYFLWYTYKPGESNNACYLIGLDKEKQICSIEPRNYYTRNDFCLGTVIYGTIYEVTTTDPPKKVFIAEDIYYYCGIKLTNVCFGDKIGFLKEFAERMNEPSIALPMMWYVDAGKEHTYVVPPNITDVAGYTPHHIQYREIHNVAPYVNVAIPKRGTGYSTANMHVSSATVAQKMTATAIMKPIPIFDFSKPTYRYPAVFNITADPQLDLYHLYAYGGVGIAVYCGLAGIQTYKTSVFMNKIFRRIRENDNLDLAEESEDETDFENTDINKYVRLELVVPIECIFNQKHKKWIPVRLARKDERIIHIEKLAYSHNKNRK